VPGSPRMRSTASDRPMVTVDSSSTWTMRSPASMPALAAGLPSITRMTVICVSRMPTSIPRPPKLPLVLVFMVSKSSGRSRLVCGSSVPSTPSTIAYSAVRCSSSLSTVWRVTKRKTSRTWVPTAHSASTSPIWNSCSVVPTRTRTRWAFCPAGPPARPGPAGSPSPGPRGRPPPSCAGRCARARRSTWRRTTGSSRGCAGRWRRSPGRPDRRCAARPSGPAPWCPAGSSSPAPGE
jgi:hypothetical protein